MDKIIENPENATDIAADVIKEGVEEIAGEEFIRKEIVFALILIILGVIGKVLYSSG